MSGGGISYGYGIVQKVSPDGTPVRGLRRINPIKAEVVRRILKAYAAGRSARRMAHDLNPDGVPGPCGGPWGASTISGSVARGNGVLNNEVYIGRLVWNRLRYVKDPATDRRRSRLNPPDLWVVEEVPELRIVSDELWNAVKASQTAVRESEGMTEARAARFWEQRRAQHLLTGLVNCGACGSRLASVGRDYLACSAARARERAPTARASAGHRSRS